MATTYYFSHDEDPVQAIEDGVVLHNDLQKVIEFDKHVFDVNELKEIKYYKVTLEGIDISNAKTN